MFHPILILPFLFQGFAIGVDEFYFHARRGLLRWELIGHPIDTLTALGCYGFLLLCEPSPFHTMVYSGLALFSCACVTKDEWVHAQKCTAGEHWLHAVLFMSHPTTLLASYFIWSTDQSRTFLQAQFFVVALFFIYQLISGVRGLRGVKIENN